MSARKADKMKGGSSIGPLLRCPVCYARLDLNAERARCKGICHFSFPLISGVPILINEKESVFFISDFVMSHKTTFQNQRSDLIVTLKKFMPSISMNFVAKKNFKSFSNLLKRQKPKPRILVIGGSIEGEGIGELLADPDFEVICTDVALGPLTKLVCDGHDLPFMNETFDGVILQAVLEHVVDPVRCVEEAHRVICKNGYIYAETPFMQQVHMGAYDFTRFTHLGHRHLFKEFSEIESGATAGPGTALAWSYRYFLLSFSSSRFVGDIVRVWSNFTSFFLKYADWYLLKKPGALDAASGYYFMGKKQGKPLSDRDLIGLYKGQN